MIPSAYPSKLTRPLAHHLIHRERLFQRLDKAMASSLLWVTAPAGMGKTSLLSSWIEVRGLPCLWYQVDSDDADLASFIHYLGVAMERLELTDIPLPKLTPELLPSLRTFLRRFVRTLFSLLTKPFALVFDNYQEAPPEAGLHYAIDIAVDEAPPHVLVTVLSRQHPPYMLGHRLAYGGTVTLNRADLTLTPEESRALAAPGILARS